MKDPRYETIKGLMKAGAIKQFTDVFTWIPPTVVAKDFGTNNNRMKRMKDDPSLWTLQEIYRLAELIECDKKMLALMAIDQVERVNRAEKNPDTDVTGCL